MVGAFLLWAILLAIVLVFVPRGVVVATLVRGEGGLDNRNPRAQLARIEGRAARANAAHQNTFEALILFAPAALAAFVTGADPVVANALAGVFLAARAVYIALYIGDVPTARSLVWAVGFLSTLGLLGLAIASV